MELELKLNYNLLNRGQVTFTKEIRANIDNLIDFEKPIQYSINNNVIGQKMTCSDYRLVIGNKLSSIINNGPVILKVENQSIDIITQN